MFNDTGQTFDGGPDYSMENFIVWLKSENKEELEVSFFLELKGFKDLVGEKWIRWIYFIWMDIFNFDTVDDFRQMEGNYGSSLGATLLIFNC